MFVLSSSHSPELSSKLYELGYLNSTPYFKLVYVFQSEVSVATICLLSTY